MHWNKKSEITPQQEIQLYKTLAEIAFRANGRQINIISSDKLPPGSPPLEAITVPEARLKAKEAYAKGVEDGTNITLEEITKHLLPLLYALIEANGAIQYGQGVAVGGGFTEAPKQVISTALESIVQAIGKADIKSAPARENLGFNVTLAGFTDVYEALREFAVGGDPEGQRLQAIIESNPVKMPHIEIQREYAPGRKANPVTRWLVHRATELKHSTGDKWATIGYQIKTELESNPDLEPDKQGALDLLKDHERGIGSWLRTLVNNNRAYRYSKPQTVLND